MQKNSQEPSFLAGVGLYSFLAGGCTFVLAYVNAGLGLWSSMFLALVAIPVWGVMAVLSMRLHRSLRAWAYEGHAQPEQPVVETGFMFAWPVFLVASVIYYLTVGIASRAA